MTVRPPITTPLAQNQTSCVNVCSPWFVDTTDEGKPVEFHPLPCSYKPLVNGMEAFGAVYDAIYAAKYSVDIVCWGFQPSMYFKRNDRGASYNIGDLLIKKGLEGVRVRILCWADTLHVAQMSENSTPNLDLTREITQNENNTELEYDKQWYLHALATSPDPMVEDAMNELALKQRTQFLTTGKTPDMPKPGILLQSLPCIQVATRDFSTVDRAEIIYRETRFRTDKGLSENAVVTGFGAEPSHHQKSVMVDYESPELAVGFVMGHNTLDAYWDDDAHSYVHMHPRFGRNGATPRQDMSALVTGGILEHLNQNFCNAWKRSTGVDLLTPRKPLAFRLKYREDIGTPVMAQINRTQSQEGRRDIRSLYTQTTNNAAKFIYIENQYFRYPPLVDYIKAAAQIQLKWGRDPGKHGPLYLFVVTNSDNDALDHGQVSTYRMMESLGRTDTMPDVTKLERADSLTQQQGELSTQMANEELKEASAGGNPILYALSSAYREQASVQKSQSENNEQQIQHQLDDVNRQAAANKNKPVVPTDIPGLKVLICTLVAPDSPAGAWMNVYVHSKIMIIDDVFTTHGSANVNSRSMEVDSELNICHEHGDVTEALRKRLWTIHTKSSPSERTSNSSGPTAGRINTDAVGDDMTKAFTAWGKIIKKNTERRDSKDSPPVASLVGFLTNTTTRSTLD
ncbi:phospholipase D-like domain-containing protein [Paraburkholderia sp.]|uniref:phospholipase D-like domain-containing protein n=1 Tax=Paraburkholderia sp. TaxID=1926495 RepID=UPI003D6EEB88